MRRRAFLRDAALLLGGLAAGGAACASLPAEAPIAVAQPLPDNESLTYNLLDNKGNKIGTATISIQRNGDALALTQNYTDLQGHTDNGTVTVDAATLRPRSVQHEIQTADLNTTLQETYSSNTVTAVAHDGSTHQHSATITNASYDDLESFFLMRVVDFTTGKQYHFDLVVADAAQATISRAASTIQVQGTTPITLGGRSIRCWQVQLSGAGASNTAWFEDAPGRRLLRYNNSRGTVLELANP